MRRELAVGLGVGLLVLVAAQAIAEPTYQTAWARQLGTSWDDWGQGASADGQGNVYISGWTWGTLGEPNAGNGDAFLAKYDAAGNRLWTRQLGTSGSDSSLGVSADGLGHVYLSGLTDGSLGGPNAGSCDNFLAKYDAAGDLLWTRQFGTSSLDATNGVSADRLGNVYLSGYTGGSLGGPNAGQVDTFLAKCDAEGNLLWKRQLGTSGSDQTTGVSADSLGNVYVTGHTNGSLGGTNAGQQDAFLGKYDAEGNLLWTRQFGTSSADGSNGVWADGLGNAYIGGWTLGSLGGPSAGRHDAFLAKYDASGDLLWARQLGTPDFDEGRSVSTDAVGNVYLTGWTDGSLAGPNVGNFDNLLAKYDPDGNLLWIHQSGTAEFDHSFHVSADALGNVFLSGATMGSLGGPHAGIMDAFVAKLTVPEPGTLLLLAPAGLCLLLYACRRGRKRAAWECHASQSSNSNIAMRPNSARLCATSVRSCAKAMDAIIRSLGPMGVPWASNCERIRP